MNLKKVDILCDQVIDVALVVKDATEVINNANLAIYPYRFVNRINSVVNYCYQLFMDVNNNEYNDAEVNDIMIELMSSLVKYKNSYYTGTYGYRVMNSLLDIVNSVFVELNK